MVLLTASTTSSDRSCGSEKPDDPRARCELPSKRVQVIPRIRLLELQRDVQSTYLDTMTQRARVPVNQYWSTDSNGVVSTTKIQYTKWLRTSPRAPQDDQRELSRTLLNGLVTLRGLDTR